MAVGEEEEAQVCKSEKKYENLEDLPGVGPAIRLERDAG